MTFPEPPFTPPTPPPPRAVPTPRRARADASERILGAAVRCIVEVGAAAVTMHEVAEEAGVSKGLIHYHFHDKETLLARVVEWLTRAVTARERRGLAESTPRTAVDDMWDWLSGELDRGHIRVLLELTEWREPLVQRAARDSARDRRAAAVESTDLLFTLLGLKPRIPIGLLADVAFVDGVAIGAADPEFNPRAAFDVFWLAVLSLAE
jgi:AcrR family transcriptional regulator